MWDITSTNALLQDISSAEGPDELLGLIMIHAQRHTRLERAVVLSRDGLTYPSFRVVFDVSWKEPRSKAGAQHAGAARAGGLLADLLYAGEYRSMSALPAVEGDPSHDVLAGATSLVAFPLLDRGAPTGMVVMLSPVPHTCPSAELCGLAVTGALLQRAHREARLAQELDAELAAAADVQRWLLPPPTVPSTSLRTAALYRTATRSGGDYYDAGPLPDGRFGVMVADVSGHGAAAAVLMAILRTIVHDEVDRSRVVGPAALLDYADDRLCALGLPSRGSFVTAFSGALDTTTGEFRYSCAGHPPPRVVCSHSRSVRSLDGASSFPLGVLEARPPRTEASVQLSPGDVIVLYSDGITEARSPSGAFFDTMELDRTLGRLPAFASPSTIVAAIEQAVTSFSGSGPPSDDQTVLTLQWQPGPAGASRHPTVDVQRIRRGQSPRGSGQPSVAETSA